MDYLTISIGIGLAVSLLFSELFGLAAGGMVVPGYIALSLHRPADVILTVLAGLVTYLLVYAVSTLMIVYGKRRTVLMILVGFIVGIAIRNVPVPGITVTPDQIDQATLPDYTVIGYIIPGLLAIWFDRQGFLETLSVLMSAAVVVRLVLILVLGTELPL